MKRLKKEFAITAIGHLVIFGVYCGLLWCERGRHGMELAWKTEFSCQNFVRNNMVLYAASIFTYIVGYHRMSEINVSFYSWINLIFMFVAIIFGFVGQSECH